MEKLTRRCWHVLLILVSVCGGVGAQAQPQALDLSGNKAIYGTDDRKDLYEIYDRDVLAAADATVALFDAGSVRVKDGVAELLLSSYVDSPGSRQQLCSDEPFVEQKTGAFCSGALVAPNVVVTAGHCITNASCASARIIFGFSIKSSAATTPQAVSASEVYTCAEVIGRSVQGSGADYAVIKLDRDVTGHKPAKVNWAGNLKTGDSLYVVGHPSGLPAKVARDAQVRDIETGTFTSNLDTFSGNSGSPVFNATTNVIEGILVRGEKDFVKDAQGKCYRSAVYVEDGKEHETSTLIAEALPFITPVKITKAVGRVGVTGTALLDISLELMRNTDAVMSLLVEVPGLEQQRVPLNPADIGEFAVKLPLASLSESQILTGVRVRVVLVVDDAEISETKVLVKVFDPTLAKLKTVDPTFDVPAGAVTVPVMVINSDVVETDELLTAQVKVGSSVLTSSFTPAITPGANGVVELRFEGFDPEALLDNGVTAEVSLLHKKRVLSVQTLNAKPVIPKLSAVAELLFDEATSTFKIKFWVDNESNVATPGAVSFELTSEEKALPLSLQLQAVPANSKVEGVAEIPLDLSRGLAFVEGRDGVPLRAIVRLAKRVILKSKMSAFMTDEASQSALLALYFDSVARGKIDPFSGEARDQALARAGVVIMNLNAEQIAMAKSLFARNRYRRTPADTIVEKLVVLHAQGGLNREAAVAYGVLGKRLREQRKLFGMYLIKRSSYVRLCKKLIGG